MSLALIQAVERQLASGNITGMLVKGLCMAYRQSLLGIAALERETQELRMASVGPVRESHKDVARSHEGGKDGVKRFWMSWHQPSDDYRPLSSPPRKITTEGGNNTMRDVAGR